MFPGVFSVLVQFLKFVGHVIGLLGVLSSQFSVLGKTFNLLRTENRELGTEELIGARQHD